MYVMNFFNKKNTCEFRVTEGMDPLEEAMKTSKVEWS